MLGVCDGDEKCSGFGSDLELEVESTYFLDLMDLHHFIPRED